MPGFLVHQGAVVLCMHAGQAQPLSPCPRVLVSSQPVVTISCPFTIAGCAMPAPPAGNGPCVSAQYVSSATRVLALGQPVLLQDSQAMCLPTGTGLTVASTQIRVRGI
jgi:hypothetical protein